MKMVKIFDDAMYWPKKQGELCRCKKIDDLFGTTVGENCQCIRYDNGKPVGKKALTHKQVIVYTPER